MGFIENTTIQIIKRGISRFAKRNAVSKDNTQIKVTIDQENGVHYFRCANMSEIEEVQFKDILGMPDLMGNKITADEFLLNSMLAFADEYQVAVTALSAFLFEHEHIICIAVYTNADAKQKKAIPLSRHFADMGVTN